MSEQQVQTKILKWLKDNSYYVFKTIRCNRAGVPDIVGCTPWGQFFGIEVKYGKNKTSKLQDWNIFSIKEVKGLALIAYDLETVTCYMKTSEQKWQDSLKNTSTKATK